jgi:transcription termination factor NusB
MAQRQPSDDRKANRRGAARLAAVQALYQMDTASTKSWPNSKAIGSGRKSKASNICRRKPRSFGTLSAAWSASSASSTR